MNFVITGGAGFIGSHLTEQLLSEGHSVTVVDNLTTGILDNLPTHPRLKILFKHILNCQPSDFSEPIDGIAHLAATPSVSQSWLRPLESHNNGLSTTVAVIELCQSLNIPRLVLASSAAVYGNAVQENGLILENLQPHPISPYAVQKLASEQYANLFAKNIGFSFVSLRLFNVFGPRQAWNSYYSGVISIFARAMQQNLPLVIYGDGHQTRDFIYVKDVANAFVKALTMPFLSGECLTCNIGTAKRTSIKEVIEIMKAKFPDCQSEINFLPPRLGDIQHSEADILNARLFLNFKPQWSVESGICSLIDTLNLK